MSLPSVANAQEQDDLYAVLNVDATASNAEIRSAYKILSSALHPDKSRSSARASARSSDDEIDLSRYRENAFRRVQAAYSVLSDELRRAIYDHFGPSCVPLLPQIEELAGNHSHLRTSRAKQELCLSNAGMLMDAIQWHGAIVDSAAAHAELRPGSLPTMMREASLQVRTLYTTQQWAWGLGTRLSSLSSALTVTGTCKLDRHTGFNTSGTLATDRVAAEASITRTLTRSTQLALKLHYGLSNSAKIQDLTKPYHGEFRPSHNAQFTVSHAFSKKLRAFLVWTFQSALWFPSIMLRAAVNAKNDLSSMLVISRAAVLLQNTWNRKISKYTRMSTSISHARSHMDVSLQITTRGFGRDQIAVAISLSESPSLTVKYSRSHFTLVVPVDLRPLILGGGIGLLGAIITGPWILLFAARSLIARYNRSAHRRHLMETLSAEGKRWWRLRRLALEQQRRMQARADDVRRHEVRLQPECGLVIVRAQYYIDRPSAEGSTLQSPPDLLPSSLSVTTPLQFFVRDSQLHLPAGSKSSVLGFFPLAHPWETKLSVTFLFRNVKYRVVISDVEELSLPAMGRRVGVQAEEEADRAGANSDSDSEEEDYDAGANDSNDED